VPARVTPRGRSQQRKNQRFGPMLQVYLPVAEISVNLLFMPWLGVAIG
jgi:hypothetical protein